MKQHQDDTMDTFDEEDALRVAIQNAGGNRAVANHFGIAIQAVNAWRRCPVHRVLDMERLGKVPRHELRPDIYPDD